MTSASAQHVSQPVIDQIQRREGLLRAGAQRLQPAHRPWLHLIQAMVALRKDMSQSYHCGPHHGEPAAIPVHREVTLQQQWRPHPVHPRHQQRNVIHPFRVNICPLSHAESLSQFVHYGECKRTKSVHSSLDGLLVRKPQSRMAGPRTRHHITGLKP